MCCSSENRGVLGQAWERAYSGAHLAGGGLMFSITWRGKRTPWEEDATAFILPDYDICSDVTPQKSAIYWGFSMTRLMSDPGQRLLVGNFPLMYSSL